MATRKKGAAGIAPAAAATKSDAAASPAPVTVQAPGDEAIANGVVDAVGAGAVEGVSRTVQEALQQPEMAAAIVLPDNLTVEGVAAIEDAVTFAQQPGQIATVLAAPIVPITSDEGGVVSSLMSDAVQTAPDETVQPVAAVRKRVEITLQDYLDDGERIGSIEVEVRTRTAPSRWRIGKQFSRTATPLDLEQLSDLEIVSLLGDEMLLITTQV